MRTTMRTWFAVSCGLFLMATSALAYEIGDVVDDFTLSDLAGEEVSISDYTEKIVVLNFFTTWCPGCNEEADHLQNDIWLEYADRGVMVVAVDLQEQLSLVQGWAAAMGVTYPIWLAPDWDLFQLFPGALGIPYNAILDPNQVIRYGAMGFDLTAITDVIEAILDEGQVPVTASSWGGVKAMYQP